MSVVQPSLLSTASRPLATGDLQRPFAFDANGAVTLGQFLGHVRGVAALLPAGRHAVNLCEDRYRFLVAFCAAALRAQITLLPPSRAPVMVATTMAEHMDSYAIVDTEPMALPGLVTQLPRSLPVQQDDTVPCVHGDACVAIGFTSGSTGVPQAYRKTWNSFIASTAQNASALRHLWQGQRPHLIATVPPQHMYGMELSVLMPLLGNAAVHSGRPFFPQEVANALRDAAQPRVLVTTPVHLRALVDAALDDWPTLAGVVCSTAPLPQSLAIAAEAKLGCEVRELFGSTETCVTAHRRTAFDSAWTPMPNVRFQPQPDGARVHAAHLPEPVAIADVVEVLPDGRFQLRGRNADLLEIAGKRASLGELNRALLEIPGVVDGVIFQLDDDNATGVRRVAALVVAPEMAEIEIAAKLRERVDPVFLPRPLRRVNRLPRNETGKLPRAVLQALLKSHAQ